MLKWLSDRFRGDARRRASLPLWQAVVAIGRSPDWYREGGVPDTIDGRFDAITAAMAVVMIRLEAEPKGAEAAARLTECFVDDMDAQMREIGIGDLVVGKQVGKLMALLGGRLGAYRDGLAGGDLAPALRRNLYRGAPVEDAAVAHVAAAMVALDARLAAMPIERVIRGAIA